MHLYRFSTGLDLKACGVLIICLISIAYVAALPVTISTEELMSRSELVRRTNWRAEVEFRRNPTGKLPHGLGESSEEPAGTHIETAVTNAIHERFGASTPVTFSKPGKTPEWVNNIMYFKVTWSTDSHISPFNTGGRIQKDEDRNNFYLDVELDRQQMVQKGGGSVQVPEMSEDEFPTLHHDGTFTLKKIP